jgi:hypothetical protein
MNERSKSQSNVFKAKKGLSEGMKEINFLQGKFVDTYNTQDDYGN